MADPAAVSSNYAAPAPDDPSTFADVEANSFTTIFDRYSRQRSVQANEDVPEAEVSADLHLSDSGFNALPLPAGARFIRLSGPRMQMLDRQQATLENQQVDQLIVHAIGWSFDKPNLENRRAGSPVEGGTGYDPAKVAAALQQYLRGTRQPPHVLISRRGDVYCLVPFSKATALSVPRNNHADIQDRSISVALEARYTARVVAFDTQRQALAIPMAEPVTEAQITALAFVSKKLMTWAGITELPVLDGTLAALGPKLGTGGSHAPGMLAYSAYDYTLYDQMLPETLVPQDWVVGGVDTLPPHLRRDAVRAAWEQRITLSYPAFGFTVGNPASDWKRVIAARASLPDYAFASELFAPPETARVFEAQPPQNTIAAANERARIVTGEAYQRAYDMSSATRSALYDAASVALDATVIAAMEKEARNRSVEGGITRVAVAQHALGFDFTDGLWKHFTVPVIPGPGEVHVDGRAPPAGSRPGANGTQPTRT